ncbi:MAG: hypothetical protein H7Y17_02080 [Chlorobia bacterium]|nr:hypothetical protein [Fimbriimonadaceae bacterium]
MMSLIAIAFVVIGQSLPIQKVTGYKPVFIPAIASKGEFIGSRVEKEGVKDYATISSRWEIFIPMNKVAESLRRGSWDKIPPTSEVTHFFSKDLPDRTIEVHLWEQFKGGTMRQGKFHPSLVTTLMLKERALRSGPLPKTWPSAARMAPSGPWSPPLLGLKLPDHWAITAIPSGLPVYRLTWYIDQDLATVRDRVAQRFPGWRRSGHSFYSGERRARNSSLSLSQGPRHSLSNSSVRYDSPR